MNPRYAAAGLASLGRRGDSTLVHMAPREVAALDRLGAKYGRRVTRNPDTGLPEAFGFLDILPMAAGLITAPFLGPIGAALASGVTAGAKTAAQGGSLGDVAMSAGISGLGSYAGSGILGAGLNAAEGAASLAAPISESAPAGLTIPPTPPTTIPEPLNTGAFDVPKPTMAEIQAAATPPTGNAPQSFIDRGIAKLGSTWENGIQNIQNIPDKLSAIANYPEEFGQGAFNYIKENPMMGIAAGANLLGMGNYTPPQEVAKDKGPTLRPGFGQSWQQTYNPMPEGYNPALQGPHDYAFTYKPPVVPGPYLAASGGEVKGMAEGGVASIDPVNLDPMAMLSQSIAQNRGANWGNDPRWGLQAPTQPSVPFSPATLPSLTGGTTLSPGVPSVPGVPGSSDVIGVPGAPSSAQPMGVDSNNTFESSGSGEGADTGEADANSSYGGGTDTFAHGGRVHRYFDGGSVRNFAEGGDARITTSGATPVSYTPMPEGYNPAIQGAWNYNFQSGAPSNVANQVSSGVPNQNSWGGAGITGAQKRAFFEKFDPKNYKNRTSFNSAFSPTNYSNNLSSYNPTSASYNPMPVGYNPAIQGAWDYGFQSSSPNTMTMADGGSVGMPHDVPGIGGFPPDAPGLNAYRNMAEGGGVSTRDVVGEAIRAASGGHPDANGAFKNFADMFGDGALAALKNKYGGGRIRGPGGGLDDLVGGTIEGKQQVRLADGEFVVPADVVSGLGGGSTDKGVHELKNMMSRIRKGATGKTTQIRRVNPRKVLPA